MHLLYWYKIIDTLSESVVFAKTKLVDVECMVMPFKQCAIIHVSASLVFMLVLLNLCVAMWLCVYVCLCDNHPGMSDSA